MQGDYTPYQSWDDLVVAVRWDHLLPFSSRLQMDELPVHYRATTVILHPDNAEHAQRLALLERAFPADVPTGDAVREVDGLLRRPRTPPDPAIEEAGTRAIETYSSRTATAGRPSGSSTTTRAGTSRRSVRPARC